MSRKATTSARPTRWSAASVPTTRRTSDRDSPSDRSEDPGDLPGLDAGEGGELLGGPGDPDPEGLQAGGVALGAHPRPVLAAPPAPEPVTGVVLGHGSPAPGAPGQRTTVGAGQEPGPAGPVEHTDDTALGPVQDRVEQAGQTVGEQTGTGIVPGAVDHLDDGPAPAFHRPGGGQDGPPLGQRHRGTRADQGHRYALTPAALHRHVHGRPGGGPLLPVGLVVGVQNHHRPQSPAGGPGPGPGPDHHAPAERGLFPPVGHQGDLGARLSQSCRQLLGPSGRRHQHQDPVGPQTVDDLLDHQAHVEGGGQPDHRRTGAGRVALRLEDPVDQPHRTPAG